MKTLVVFYSRTGTTKKVAEKIARALKCDKEEIKDTVKRSGPVGYMRSGREAAARKLTELKKIKKDPAGYDLVVVGTPIWAWNVSSPVRTYLTKNKSRFKKVAFFCTMGGSGAERAFKEMERLVGKKPSRTLALTTNQVVRGDPSEQIKRFTSGIIKTKARKKRPRS